MTERHLKRLKDTLTARIISVMALMAMVFLMALCGKITYADEQDPDPIIIIPDSTDDKDQVSGNEGSEGGLRGVHRAPDRGFGI